MPEKKPTARQATRTENELLALRDGILSLAVKTSNPLPVGGGITVLGKFEAIVPESRFKTRPNNETINWIQESLSMRMRQGKYRSAAVFLPSSPDQLGSLRGQIITSHQSFGRILHSQMQVKSKRPGQITISRVEKRWRETG